MLIKPTQERLRAMRLSGMAEAFATQMEDTGAAQLSFEELLLRLQRLLSL